MAKVATLFGEWDEPEPRPASPWPEDAEEHFYILDENGGAVPVLRDEWQAWCNSESGSGSNVATADLGGGWKVITSFDGSVDADDDKEGEAPLFWTRVLIGGSFDDDYVASYRSWADAEAGHRNVVEQYGKRLAQAVE